MKYHFDDSTQETLWNEAVWGLALVSKEGRFVKVNPKLCALLEYTESELLSKTFEQITHPEDIYDDVHMAHKVEEGEKDYYVMTKRYITKRDSVVWCKLKVNGVHDENERFVHFLSQIGEAITMVNNKDPYNKKTTQELSKPKGGAVSFFKSNAKWLIPMILSGIITVIGFGYKLYYDYQTLKDKIDSLTTETTISQEE